MAQSNLSRLVGVAPGADRPGVDIHHNVLVFVAKIAGLIGHKLVIGTGTNHSKFSTSGLVSDHWDGEAADISASGGELVKLGQAALIAAGMPAAEARKEHGGLYNVGAWQIIFNTPGYGGHLDHLHVGYSSSRGPDKSIAGGFKGGLTGTAGVSKGGVLGTGIGADAPSIGDVYSAVSDLPGTIVDSIFGTLGEEGARILLYIAFILGGGGLVAIGIGRTMGIKATTVAKTAAVVAK